MKVIIKVALLSVLFIPIISLFGMDEPIITEEEFAEAMARAQSEKEIGKAIIAEIRRNFLTNNRGLCSSYIPTVLRNWRHIPTIFCMSVGIDCDAVPTMQHFVKNYLPEFVANNPDVVVEWVVGPFMRYYVKDSDINHVIDILSEKGNEPSIIVEGCLFHLADALQPDRSTELMGKTGKMNFPDGFIRELLAHIKLHKSDVIKYLLGPCILLNINKPAIKAYLSETDLVNILKALKKCGSERLLRNEAIDDLLYFFSHQDTILQGLEKSYLPKLFNKKMVDWLASRLGSAEYAEPVWSYTRQNPIVIKHIGPPSVRLIRKKSQPYINTCTGCLRPVFIILVVGVGVMYVLGIALKCGFIK